MASSLDDTVPQWKKDLILRKRAVGDGAVGSGAATAASANASSNAVSSVAAVRQERCDSVVKMVQDSVLVMRPVPVATNGDCCRGGSDSDSSEELQYGPGIVSKLKSKYLSLTLRETHAVAPRPSILPLRRAASLEQLLDADDAAPATTKRKFAPRAPAPAAPSPRYRAQSRRNGTEAVKRARSVETISRSQPVEPPAPGARKPCRPLRITPVLDHAERPPADHVKQTLRLFEGPALRRTKAPAPTGDVAAKVASFKQIIQQNKPGTPPPPPPPPLSPKPTVLPPKPINIPPVPSSPVKTSNAPQSPVKTTKPVEKSPVAEPSPIPDVLDAAAGLCPTPDLIVHSSPQPRPFSPRTLQDVTQNFLKLEIMHSQHIYKPASPIVTSPPPIMRPKSPIIIPQESPPKLAPTSIPSSRSPSPRIPPPDPPSESPTSKEITRQAVDNIAKAGHTITYRFSEPLSPKSQSHLPRLNSVPMRIKLVPDTTMSSPPLKPMAAPVLSPVVVPVAKPPKVVNGGTPPPRPTTQPPKAPLTSREIEKNSINKLKTLEQPVSKVVVAMRSVDEVVAKKAKPRAPPQETTILFNFSARESIPDYIATDGSQNVRRGKREKPKPGESGIILLPGAPAEEFADDDEDWMLSLNGPPSPCDVHFVNDNILIDGRSSISKQPKRQKLRIQFDDDATQVFEYLSEASALEDTVPSTPPVTSPPPVAGHTVPSLTGSSLASYTPSKMSVTADFQLGVTRQPPVVTCAPQAAAPDSLDLLPVPADHPVTYSAETTADILF